MMEATLDPGLDGASVESPDFGKDISISNWPTDRFPYQLIDIAGEGSTAIVYHALDVNLRREVAIKVLRSGFKWAPLKFLQEARTAATLRHPGAVGVYRIDACKGSNFLVMEWVDGSTLDHAVQSRPFTVRQAIAVMNSLLSVLDAAHRAGIVHRDIKPSNLLLSKDGRLKVTDFGIARSLETSLTESTPSSVLATPRFASPEQLSGRMLDSRSDLFSAALVFYYLLSGGRTAFSGDTVADTITNILIDNPVPVTRWRGTLPPRFDSFFKQALARNPTDRYQNARQMQRAVRQLLASEGRLAAPRRIWRTRDPLQGNLLLKLIASWPERVVDVEDFKESFRKLLLDRFHGVITAGGFHLFIADGRLVAAVDASTGMCTNRVRLPDSARLRLKVTPRGCRIMLRRLTLAPLATPQRSQFHSDILDLRGLFARLAEREFSGSVYLTSEDSFAIDIFTGGTNQLLVLGGHWAREPRNDFATWLQHLNASVSVHDDEVADQQLEYDHITR